MNRKRLIAIAATCTVLALADWFTLEVGLLKPIVFGAGSLQVTTDPSAAEVRLDGLSYGPTPLHIDTLLTGTYTLLIRHRFHLPLVETISVERGQDLEMDITLPAAHGELLLATNPVGATIVLDGEKLDALTPLTIPDLVAGEHHVELEIYGRERISETIDVLPDAHAEVVAELNRLARGQLTVRPQPTSASVTLLDAPVPYTPEVLLPVGDYRIRVAARGYRPNSQVHRLHKGVNIIDVTLARTFGTLTVRTSPADARVSVRTGMHTEAVAYQPDMTLPTGAVEVTVKKAGYRTVIKQLNLTESGSQIETTLHRFTVAAGDTIQDSLRSGGSGPRLIVIPAGKVDMGEPGASGINALTPRTVTLSDPFAISITEITRGEFARYADSEGIAMPDVKGMDTDAHPIALVSWEAADAFTRWLTRETGNLYRLPSEAEWAYVAIRGELSGPACEQGNIADITFRKLFQQWQKVECKDGYVRSAPVGSYQANAFGVYDMLGNVSEWVSDCSFADCSTHIARGSAWDSGENELRMTFRESRSGAGDSRGMRVVREL